ncbi:sulfite exporter TauE/SafE family protein [[Eubacterium] cellulosolvens]
MLAVTVEGLMLGLSTGVFCLAYCGPVFVPFMISEKRGLAKSAVVVGELAVGRLIAYLSVGAAAGYLGMRLEGPVSQRVIGLMMVILSAFLILYVATRWRPRFTLCRWISGKRYIQFPFIFGFLTGINICPPFLLAISYALDLGSMFKGAALFGGFFLGTSVYLLLLLPLGYLGRWQSLRLISLMTALLTGIFFLVLGIIRLMAI